MKKIFIILFGLIVVIAMVGCLNLEGIFPFLNQAPVIISKPIITATEDQLYSYQVEASDPNGDTLTYSFIIKPEEMSIDNESGLISWTPANNQVGIHQVVVEISDDKHSVNQSFEIEVFNVNNPPQIFSFLPNNLNVGVNEGDSIKFEAQAHDIDLNTTLSFQWFLNEKLVSDSTISGNDSQSSWNYSTGYGDYGQKRVKILVSDGELQDYVQWNITINDITPPAQPTLNTVTSPTNIPTQTLSGIKESNTSIWINGAEVILINSDTTWSHPYSLSEETNNISITSRDAAGNESLSITANIILDTISPMVPTLNSIISPTNISTQVLRGTKEADTAILINGTGVIPINSETTWSYSLYLIEGTNDISITSRDAAGNESSSVSTIIVLDISTPEIPTLNDAISPTNISPQILSGTKEANTSIWINGTEVVSLDSSTKWSYPFTLIEGENNISITSCDAVGNESAAVNDSITLDTIPPITPTLHNIISPTNICTQLLSGNKEINSSILVNGIEVIPVNSETFWSYDFEFTEGENSISIISRDSAGNESNEINATIILDTTAPAIPSLETIISPTNISTQILSGTKEVNSSILINGAEVIFLNSPIDWSYSYNLSEGTNNISVTSRDAASNESSAVIAIIILDTINPVAILDAVVSPTNVSPQTLSGIKETNTSVWINNMEIIPINPSTTWTYYFHLSEGENNISITSRDIVGNESLTITANIVLDTIIPVVPTLDTVTSPTNVTPQILSGNKETNSSIWINVTEVISINSDITWSYTFDLVEGNNNISITSRDASGNESTAVTTNIVLDTIAPEIPTLNAVTSPTNISPQILSGTKEAKTSVWINGTEAASLDSSVNWLYYYNLTEGINNISITSRDTVGNESSAITVTIEYDPNIYVNAGNTTGTEDGTKTHPFNTITEGLIAVSPGKSVMVAVGTYNEQLIINKEITLQGAEKESTIISGFEYTGNLITIEADNITITGFTINGFSSTSIGLYFDSYSSININNNIIQNNSSYGINYSNSSPTIENNNIKNNNYSGMDIGTGGAGIIRNNFVVSNKYGIRTYGDSCPEITGNNISNNNTGIYCRESATPIISYNTINNNSGYGILIDNILGNSVNPDIGGVEGGSAGKNNITGNYIHGVRNKTTHNIYAKYNWWGDTAGPKYPGNNSSSGDWAYWSETGGDIIFNPHLTAEP